MDTRRTFVFGAGAAALNQVVKPKLYGANNRIRMAVLGVHGRGNAHVNGFSPLPDVEVAVLCDPDAEVLAQKAALYQEKYGHKFETEQDLRKVLERKDIDAVSIATPNHWHALATIWACQAGKDVYVEKPGCHNIFEGRQMVAAAHKYNRIVQHGVQLRSSEAVQEAIGHLRSGLIGKVYMARGLVFRWRPSIGHKPPEAAPATLNWDIWQGPAQTRQFSRNIVHYNWHWHWDYGNGDVGNQGIHETDLCMWGLGVDKLPSRITALGGKFLFDDDKQTPETLSSSYLFPEENKMIEFEVRPWATNKEDGVGVGNIFYGSDGYLVVKGYDYYESYVNQGKEKGPSRKAGGNHWANFIKAVRSRKTSDQNGPVETAALSSSLAHLGNISYRLNRQLQFDPKAGRFTGDDQANAMLTRSYRAPFVVPEKV